MVKIIVRKGKGHGWGDFWKSKEDVNEFADWLTIIWLTGQRNLHLRIDCKLVCTPYLSVADSHSQ